MKVLSLILAVMFLASCSSTRVHEKPNFNLTGEAAKKEQEKFQLMHISNYGGKFENEGPFTSFKLKDFKNTLSEISPKSIDMLEKTKTAEYVSLGIFAAWLGTIFIKNSDGKVSSLYWWSAGAFLGSAFYLEAKRDDIIDQYNKDLKNKFIPTVGYKFQY